MAPSSHEWTDTLKDVYTARAANADLNARYIPLLPVNQRIQHERDRALANMLRQHLSVPPAQARVLEVGCGSGSNLLDLIRLGFDPANLMGNDLMDSRVEQARHRLPQAVPILAGNALDLDLEREGFDVLYQSTVFTSILDAQARRDLAQRMWHWTKPGGGVLWYDFAYNNPRNPNVRGVPLREVRALFPTPASTPPGSRWPRPWRVACPPHCTHLSTTCARSCAPICCAGSANPPRPDHGAPHNRRRACPGNTFFPPPIIRCCSAALERACHALPRRAGARPSAPGKPSDTSYTLRRTMGTQEQQAVNNGTSYAKLAWTLGVNCQ